MLSQYHHTDRKLFGSFYFNFIKVSYFFLAEASLWNKMLPSVASEEEYEVERILDKRVDKFGFTEYLVKWKNYQDPEVWSDMSDMSDSLHQ